MGFIDRLQAAMDQKDVTAYKLCKDLNFGQSTFSSWKQGKMPSIEKIQAIVQYLEISADWLLETEKDQKPKMKEDEARLLENYRRADRRGKETIQLIAEQEAQMQKIKGKSSDLQTG